MSQRELVDRIQPLLPDGHRGALGRELHAGERAGDRRRMGFRTLRPPRPPPRKARTRLGEAATLRRRSVNLLTKRLTIEESIAEVSGRLVFGPTKTHAMRKLPLPPSLTADSSGTSRRASASNRTRWCSRLRPALLCGTGISCWVFHSTYPGRPTRPLRVRTGASLGSISCWPVFSRAFVTSWRARRGKW